MNETTPSQSKTAFSQLISILDRAWDARWAIQLIQLVLFLDLAMIVAGQPGLLGWNSKSTPVLNNLNFVIITLTAFTVYAAFLTPMISFVVRNILLEIPGFFHLLPNESHEQPYNYVSVSEYGREAFRLNNKDMIIFYRATQENERSSWLAQRQIGNVFFATAIMIVVNVFPAVAFIETDATLLQVLTNLAGSDVSLVIGVALAIAFWVATTTAWFYRPIKWIEQPKFYQKQQEKERAERKEVPPYINS